MELCWMAFVLTVNIVLASAAPFPAGNSDEFCTSQGGHFPKFSLEGKRPQMSAKGPNDLTFCRIYRKKTCCTAAQTHPALIAIRKLASDGQGSERCLMLWEAMECSICDPQVGVKQGPPVLCNSFCKSLYEDCGDAFFSFDSMNQVLTPCGPKDIICARGTEWASNSTYFCQLAGFRVSVLGSLDDSSCFDGKPNLDTGKSAERTHFSRKKLSSLQMLNRWRNNLESSDVVLWAIGGLVLTAGVLLIRRRSLSSQRKKAVMLRFVKEAQMKHQTASKPDGGRRKELPLSKQSKATK